MQHCNFRKFFKKASFKIQPRRKYISDGVISSKKELHEGCLLRAYSPAHVFIYENIISRYSGRYSYCCHRWVGVGVHHDCSNTNEVIRAVLNFFLFFFSKRFCTHQKHQKAQRCNQAKTQNAISEQKWKNALKKHLRGKKSLIRLCAFLCFLCARRKGKRRK